MDQEAPLIRLAVFGNPVKHSLSPRIHRLFGKQAGIPVDYAAVLVEEGFLSREVQKLADAGGRGCNITLPLKFSAFHLANEASERAKAALSANTLLFRTPTRWLADNTDGSGLVHDLVENLRVDARGRRVCIVGAGGAVAGILHDVLRLGPASLTLANRTQERALELADRFTGQGSISVAVLDDLADLEPFDLVIHATSAGHFRQEPILQDAMFGPGSRCYDLNYGLAHESLSAWCAERGITCHDGLGMLVEQAAESFHLWTDFRPQTADIISQLRAGMNGT